MNKRKLAVFVEGQTELIFVREFLKQWYSYDSNAIGFDCYNLLANEFCDTAYKYGSEESENYYFLVNVGNDGSVLSSIIGRMKFLQNKGFQLVIGLRDMYSRQYIRDAGKREIVETVNQQHIESVREVLKGIEGGMFVDFHFAIMEVEAWFLGMPEFIGKLDERLTPEYIQQNVGLTLDDDPEKTVFHPAKIVGEIYALVGKHYDKHQSDVSSIMARLTTEDYLRLIESGKCSTFRTFAESLLGTVFRKCGGQAPR